MDKKGRIFTAGMGYPVIFVPAMLATLALAFASFYKKKNAVLIAFVVWLFVITMTIVVNVG